MTNYTLWSDRGTGSQDIYKIAKYLKECAGGTVNVLGVGPSVGQNYGLHSGKGTVAVYQTNGVGLATPNDLEMGCKPGGYYKYDRAIFVWPQWIGNQYMSDKNILNHIVPGEWDWNRDSSYNVGGMTAAKWFSQAKYVDLVSGSSPQDVAKRICSETYVNSSGNPGSATSGRSSSYGKTSYSGSLQGNNSDSSVSPLLEGIMTFEELVGEICKGIDLMFMCKRSTVVVDSFEGMFAEAKWLRDNHSSAVSAEDIKLWQIEEDSYELNVDHHGFYNTVYLEYKNGIVREAFEDFVTIYGEVSIKYSDKTLDKTSAIMKAKAYLAAHIRDFEQGVNVTISSEPDIDIGDIITLENPKTKKDEKKLAKKNDAEYLFVKGINTNWEGDSNITTDLEIKFAPTSPNKKEVPTAGNRCSGSDSNSNKSKTGSSTGGGGSYNKCGVSSDKKTICGIGRSSAVGETSKYGRGFYRSVFKNNCPFCNQATLIWDIFYAGNETSDWGYSSCKGSSEGGSSDGHFFCTNCDADFSIITGADHNSPPKAYLTRVSGPDKASKEDAYNLKKGTYSI